MMGWGGVSEQEWRKGPWTPEEDKLLTEYVRSYGEGRWSSVATCAGLKRSGKSCRLRWVNYLRPGLKRGHITPQEEGIIIELHALWGNKWSTIARYLPGRTDNEIKNYWRTHFKKKRKPSDKQEKRKFHSQKNQQDESNLVPQANVSVSPQSDVTSDPKMMAVPQADQQETLFTYPNMENQYLPAPMNHDVLAWPDTIPLDDLWGWLWNLEDQSGRGGQTDDSGKMAFQNQANVWDGEYIY